MNTIKSLALSVLIASLAGSCVATQAGEPAPVAPSPTAQQARSAPAGVVRYKIGRYTVYALSDGTLPLDLHLILKDAPAATLDALLEQSFQRNPAETSINAFLIDTGSRRLLVDTGSGELFGAVGGRLLRSLAAAGYRPEDITDVLITHIHTDHSGGLTVGGRRIFPNATVRVGQPDVAWFLAAANVGKGLEQRQYDEAVKTVRPYQDAGRLEPFSGRTQLFPGVIAIPTPGHTPGHSFYRIESEGESMEFWGDIVHIGPVQLPQPSITITFDNDQAAARAQRLLQFERAAAERQRVAVAHLNFPGVGYLRRNGTGYDWVPAAYTDRD